MEPKNIYVAGAVIERNRISAIIDRISTKHTVTHDWTQSTESNGVAAKNDILGVVKADLVLALLTVDDYQYRGTLHEIGAAMAMRFVKPSDDIQIWIVSSIGDPRGVPREDRPNAVKSCFEQTADRYFSDVEEALKELGV